MDATIISPVADPGLEAGPQRLTPMMAQYFEIKAANPDCLLFYRMGDFYELFFDDAEVASRALGIVLTKRGKHDGEDIRMCGVPIERADDYLNRLIALGHRVAVCEQLEDPAEAKKRGAKSVVKRDVVRLVTPGTITEERLLEPGRARLLVAVQRIRGERRRAGPMDLRRSIFRPAPSPCRRRTRRALPQNSRGSSRARSSPRRRCSTSRPFGASSPTCGFPRRRSRARRATGRRPSGGSANSTASRRSTASAPLPRAEIAAAALALAYVKRTQFEARPALSPPTRRARGASLEIDAATRANLELTRTLTGAREGSLLATIDLTVTPAGARLLAERLASPLTDPAAIDERLDALAFLVEAAPTARRAAPRACRRARLPALAVAPQPRSRRPARPRRRPRRPRGGGRARAHSAKRPRTCRPSCRAPTRASRADCGALTRDLHATLADDLPLVKRDGGFVRAGALRAARRGARPCATRAAG